MERREPRLGLFETSVTFGRPTSDSVVNQRDTMASDNESDSAEASHQNEMMVNTSVLHQNEMMTVDASASNQQMQSTGTFNTENPNEGIGTPPSASSHQTTFDTINNSSHFGDAYSRFTSSAHNLVENFFRPLMAGEEPSIEINAGNRRLHIQTDRVADEDEDEDEEELQTFNAAIPNIGKPGKTLEEMDIVRPIRLRPGRFLKFARPTNKHATSGQSRGPLAQTPCLSCQRHIGPFTECVVVPGLFKGACCNCVYNSGSTGCSFRNDQSMSTLVDHNGTIGSSLRVQRRVSLQTGNKSKQSKATPDCNVHFDLEPIMDSNAPLEDPSFGQNLDEPEDSTLAAIAYHEASLSDWDHLNSLTEHQRAIEMAGHCEVLGRLYRKYSSTLHQEEESYPPDPPL